MKQIFITISDHIRASLPEIKWIDADYGQLDNTQTRAPLAFPALLIRSSIRPEDMGGGSQLMRATVNLRLIFNPATLRTAAHTPEEAREVSLAYLDTADRLYLALQGFENDDYTPFECAAQQQDAPAGGLLIVNYTFQTSFWDFRQAGGVDKLYLSENFDTMAGVGGNDGVWSAITTQTAWNTDIFELLYVNQAAACIRLGSGSNQGAITTPSLGLDGDAKIRVRLGIWNASGEQTEIRVKALNGGELRYNDTIGEELLILAVKGEFSPYEIDIVSGTADTRIKFEGKNKNSSRFFLDDLIISKF